MPGRLARSAAADANVGKPPAAKPARRCSNPAVPFREDESDGAGNT
ncbi:MAG: hypothetical protein JWL58_7222, partial [Streptosporangiaceae bacterium]|nr:hypothetical protein [Streptosporangiaceae bacterium]